MLGCSLGRVRFAEIQQGGDLSIVVGGKNAEIRKSTGRSDLYMLRDVGTTACNILNKDL
ncbi:hypothetical protein MARINON1_51429 [Marinobacter salarius]|nr:hypothetical protein MBHK15_130182 [Marinobacter salarius]VXB84619.1 hypothetical protein MARINON1_51429 [Marinobacter salarius]